jgi:hypothetical protein
MTENKSRALQLVQELAAIFQEQNMSIVCRELLGLKGADNFMPEIRTEEYFSKRPCKQLVGMRSNIRRLHKIKRRIEVMKIAVACEGKTNHRTFWTLPKFYDF